jgi:integrase
VSIAEFVPEPWIPKDESHREWAVLSTQAPQLAATMRRYLVQLTTFLAPRSVDVADSTLRQLARWLVAETEATVVSDITRRHVEDYKVWLAAQPGCTGPTLAKNTQRQRLRMIRIFFERLIEWDWPEAHHRNPILHGDIPPRPEPLPKFLSDEDAAKLLAAAKAHRLPRYRLVVEMLSPDRHAGDRALRTGPRCRQCPRRLPLAAHPGRQVAQRSDDPAARRPRAAPGGVDGTQPSPHPSSTATHG